MTCDNFYQTKDPSDVEDFSFDYTTYGWLQSGETITSSNWTLASGITKISQGISSGVTTVRVSGGTDGEDYTVTNTIVTSNTRTKEVSFTLQVRNR